MSQRPRPTARPIRRPSLARAAALGVGLSVLSAPAALGQAAAGDPAAIDFKIEQGSVTPATEFAAKVTVIGCSWSTELGELGPVTVEMHVGGESIMPFGNAADYLAGDINTGALSPVSVVIQDTFAADTAVSVTGRAWQTHYLMDGPSVQNSATASGTSVLVLRDGDPVPRFTTTAVQIPIEVYLQGYTDNTGEHIVLGESQAIYLFDFNDPNWDPPEYMDYQDLVVLITFGESPEALGEQVVVPPSTVEPLFD